MSGRGTVSLEIQFGAVRRVLCDFANVIKGSSNVIDTSCILIKFFDYTSILKHRMFVIQITLFIMDSQKHFPFPSIQFSSTTILLTGRKPPPGNHTLTLKLHWKLTAIEFKNSVLY